MRAHGVFADFGEEVAFGGFGIGCFWGFDGLVGGVLDVMERRVFEKESQKKKRYKMKIFQKK